MPSFISTSTTNLGCNI